MKYVQIFIFQEKESQGATWKYMYTFVHVLITQKLNRRQKFNDRI